MIRYIVAAAALSFLLAGFTTLDIDQTLPASDIAVQIRIDRVIELLSLEEKVGQLFIVDLRRSNGSAVLEFTPAVKELLERFHPGGILLFGENIDTVEQTRELTAALQRASAIPLMIATDYEGGVVSRLTSSGKIPATRIPPASVIGATGDRDLAYRVGTVMGAELAALGITMNFAPIADILTNPESMIGNRAFSDDVEVVTEMVGAMIRGIQDTGVSSVVKHYPGHGDTALDSHDGLVVIPHGIERLRTVELRPFAEAIENGVDGVMTAHIIAPEITGERIPTTFSRELLTEVLRNELGHTGLIITDSLTMQAIRSGWSSGESAVKAISAGADIILQALDLPGAVQGLLDSVASGELTEARIDESVRRIIEIKLRRGWITGLPADPYAILGCEEHRRVIEAVQ